MSYSYLFPVVPRVNFDEWLMGKETDPGTLPLTLAEAKSHLKIDESYTVEDADITRKLAAAVQLFEQDSQRTVRASVMCEWTRKDLPTRFAIPRPPLISVGAIYYVDPDEQLVEIPATDYRIIVSGKHPSYVEMIQTSSATPIDSVAAYCIKCTTGYADAASVPESLKEGILLGLDILYDNDLHENQRKYLVGARQSIIDAWDGGQYR